MNNSDFIRHIRSSMILTLGIQAKLNNICSPEKHGRLKKQVSYMLQTVSLSPVVVCGALCVCLLLKLMVMIAFVRTSGK